MEDADSNGRIRRGDLPGRAEATIIRWLGEDERHVFHVEDGDGRRLDGSFGLEWTETGVEPGQCDTISGLLLANGEVAGCFKFREFPLPQGADDDAVRSCILGSHVNGAATLADAVLARWAPEDIAPLGTVVWFERLWVAPASAVGSRWAVSVNAFIEARYGRHGPVPASLMLMKPFPLEYEAAFRQGDGTPLHALEHRKAAMHRLYAARLHAQEAGGEWMWRPLDGRVSRPQPQPEPRSSCQKAPGFA